VSLFETYDDYLVSMSIDKERDPHRLFVTDVGKCPRQVALRLLGHERKPILPQKRMMWDLAEYIEETLMKALDAAGELLEYQAPIDISDRENWGGRLDIVRSVDGNVQIVEVKTERSNALARDKNGDLKKKHPKQNHVYQATIYDHYYDYEDCAALPPALWYAARGGSNPPYECEIVPDFAPIKFLMDELDEVRAALPEVPPMLPKTLKLVSYGKTLKYVAPWDCGYCDYAGLSCFPDMSEETWGSLDGGWHPTDKAKLGLVSQWAAREGHEALLAAL
jgi:hypothetical protein